MKNWLCKNSSSSQPAQEADDLMSDEQIAKQLQMDEDMMEVGGSIEQLVVHCTPSYSWDK